MKNAINKVLVVFTACLFITPVLAENIDLETARKNISKQFKGVNINNITPSPVPGLFQVSMPPRFFYASADGRYIVDGDLIDMKSKQNVSQAPRNSSVAAAINAMGEDSMIIFGKDTLKHTVTVFTDIDCGYCRKLHSEIKKYNELGIRVRYMAYPRAGIGSSAYKKAEAVWCSKDKAAALTKSKNGGTVKAEKCKNPVAQHYALGNMIGIRGTPAIVLHDGTVVPGYIPAARLSEALNKATR
ncbi:MAG: bifunctional protein-disulfide isomerase/oxidoreductase DsbC [Gammaproteobacteria bacterium]|nr:MAG: bifunctional protein-disulfide isomerase/oxidoreductase DsbC [Gammaproteobacteria bacterium]